MQIHRIFILLVLPVLPCLQEPEEKEEETELVQVQIVFRHGDRTPIDTYPGNPYNWSIWEQYGGPGQLTQIGMKQGYEYGKYLRKRYSKVLSQRYDRKRVFVRSTDYDRTLMTAQSVLAGLYKPVRDQIWKDDLLWQPIPVSTKNYEKVCCNKKIDIFVHRLIDIA